MSEWIDNRMGRGRGWDGLGGWGTGGGQGGVSGVSMGAGIKDSISMGRGVVKYSVGTLHPTIYSTDSKYHYFRVIISLVEKRQ